MSTNSLIIHWPAADIAVFVYFWISKVKWYSLSET